MDHSREVLKSHSEIYKGYGFLVQGETQFLGPCCSNVGQRYPPEITLKRIRRSNCVTYWIQIYPGESVSPGGVSQLFKHTASQSLSSADLPLATRIGEYNTRPSLHHRESLQPSLSFGSSYNPTQRFVSHVNGLPSFVGNGGKVGSPRVAWEVSKHQITPIISTNFDCQLDVHYFK